MAPAALAEKIRRQRPAEGERRIVTVLFVDAVESTPLAERLGEEEMYSLMRGAIERMGEAVHAHEGHVATFTDRSALCRPPDRALRDAGPPLHGRPGLGEGPRLPRKGRRQGGCRLRQRDALEFYGRALEVCARLGGDALPAAASLAARRAFVDFGIGDVTGAISDFDRMLDAARRLGHRSLEGPALGFRGFMEVYSNDWEQAEVTLRSAQAIAEEGFDEVRPLANIGLTFLMLSSNRFPEAEPLLLSADEIAALPDPFLEGLWNWFLGFVQHWWGHSRQAVETLRQMSEAAGRIVGNRLWHGWAESLALATTGEYEEALRLLETVQSTSERVGDVLILPRAYNTFGWIYGELQDHQRALECNQACVDFVQGIPGFPNPDVEPHARINLGDNLIALGRPDEADAQFEAAEAVCRSPRPADRWMAWRSSQHLFHSYGELWLARGDLERAQAYADECLEVALFNSSAKNVVKARRLQGQILLARGRLKEAEEELAAALATAHEVGNPPQLWKTHAAIGELRRAEGRPDDARQAYAEALSVIEGVAASLTDQQLRDTFLHSEHVEMIRRQSKPQPV